LQGCLPWSILFFFILTVVLQKVHKAKYGFMPR
jgi:hypothetical protein